MCPDTAWGVAVSVDVYLSNLSRKGNQMKGRYELRHDTYGRGYRYTDLRLARKEIAKCIPASTWYIFDRLEKRRVS